MNGSTFRAGCLAAGVGLLFALSPPPARALMRTVPKGQARSAPVVRKALSSPTFEGRVEGLIDVLVADDLPAALEAMEVLADLGPRAVPRLVSEMRRVPNNWLIGGALVRMGSLAVDPLVELLEDAGESTAVDCIYLLGEIQDRRAIPVLARYLDDSRDRVRMYAVTGLLQIGGAPAVEAVLSRLTREGKAVESFIVEALIRYGHKSVEPVILSMTSLDPRVRREAAFLLGQLEDLRAMDPLVLALEDDDPRVRQNAAFGLGQLAAHTREAEYAVEALAERLSDPAEEVVAAARDALVYYGERAVPFLLEACQSDNPSEVTASLNALRKIGSSAAEDTMLELLRHPLRDVRVAAAAGLIATGTGRSVEALLDALRDEDLRWFAALALEQVGQENPALFFSASPNDPTMSLRTQILVRLGQAVVPFLVESLRDENVGRQAAALWILGEIGEPEVAPVVAPLLDDPRLGWLAGRCLSKLGEGGLDQVLRLLNAAPTTAAAEQAVEALSLFGDERAWDALELAVAGPLPRTARVRSAVLLSEQGDPQRIARLRSYFDRDGRSLWPDVEAALRAAGEVR
jgi:HEAT repeat protein